MTLSNTWKFKKHFANTLVACGATALIVASLATPAEAVRDAHIQGEAGLNGSNTAPAPAPAAAPIPAPPAPAPAPGQPVGNNPPAAAQIGGITLADGTVLINDGQRILRITPGGNVSITGTANNMQRIDLGLTQDRRRLNIFIQRQWVAWITPQLGNPPGTPVDPNAMDIDHGDGASDSD